MVADINLILTTPFLSPSGAIYVISNIQNIKSINCKILSYPLLRVLIVLCDCFSFCIFRAFRGCLIFTQVEPRRQD